MKKRISKRIVVLLTECIVASIWSLYNKPDFLND